MSEVELQSNGRPLRVLETGVYRGPHLYSHIPMIRIQVDLGTLEERPTNTLPGFTERLLELLPGLRGHGCSLRRPGGLVVRLTEGTWLGHVAEHIALELQTLAGSRATRGKTRSVSGRPGAYNIMFEYNEADVGLHAGRLALELVESLLPPELQGMGGLDRIFPAPARSGPFDVGAAIQDLQKTLRRAALGPTTASLVKEAKRRGIPVLRLDEMSLIQLGYGARQQRLRASITGRTPHIAVETASDKDLTKAMLDKAGVPVPRGAIVRSADAAVEEARRLRPPLVTKPLDGNHGRGVSLDLITPDQIRWGFEQAVKHGRRVVVEEQLKGRDHRILIVDGEVVAVAERAPARVVGDGDSSIAALIEQVNRDPRRGEGHEKVMTRIKVDEHVMEVLGRAGLTLDSVPAAGQVVPLRTTANLSTGGTAIDRTDEIHPENACIARRAALTLGLDVAGVDFIAPDISRSVRETGGGVVEVNAAPGFRMHLEPSEGRARDVARPVIRMLFPRGARSRIPIFAVTGTNGKSTTARMLSRVLRQTGVTVGLTSTSGVYVNDERLAAVDASGPKSARMVLRDPTVDVAVLETARGGILREGLAFDECDVGVVLNVQPDHLGLKGIDTLEDLAWVKSVVVEAVRPGGCSVLNADDPMTIRMQRRAGGRLAFFSMRGGEDMPPFLQKHVARGGLAVVLEPSCEGGAIVIHDEGERTTVMRAAQIPATFDGMAEFNVQNALAAVTMAHAHGIPLAAIRSGLSTFYSSFEQSPGRMNLFDGHGFRVILDYAHNPSGLSALGALIDRMRPQYDRTIGMISIPGDRRDEDLREMGAIAARTFDLIVFREDFAHRGRRRGDVLRLMTEGAKAAGCPEERIHCIASEREATEHCLRLARPGDLVVITPTEVDAVWRQVVEFRPQRVFDLRPAPQAAHA